MMKRLYWLELGRGVAAFGVVLAHANSDAAFMHALGSWGVAFFFVLSGFIIHHVHADDLGVPRKALRFAWRRFARIFPTYWLVLAIFLFVRQDLGNPGFALELTPTSVLANALLLPDRVLYVDVAWTLRHELLFYAVFLVAIINMRAALTIGVGWLALIVHSIAIGNFAIDYSGALSYLAASPLDLLFLLGVIVSLAMQKHMLGPTTTAAVAAAIIVLLLRLTLDASALPFLTQAAACLAIVACAASMRNAPPGSALLGALSYPLYLIHITMYLIAHGIIVHSAPRLSANFPATETVLAVLLSLAAAYVLSRIERPMLKRLAGQLRQTAPQPVIPTTTR